MNIIAHRGYWKNTGEKNSVAAFERAIENGFGIETDIRDNNGRLVVAHDIPLPGEDFLSFDDFLTMYSKNRDENALLAINIKSDGLSDELKSSLSACSVNYFAFDMSLPQLYFGYRKSGLHFYSSVNEFMRVPMVREEAKGIWLDAYTHIWYNTSDIREYLQMGKGVCIVSPELHGREYKPLWEMIKGSGLDHHALLSICTDLPMEADNFFDK